MHSPPFPGEPITTNGNQLVAATEARLADCGVFYPITPSTEQGEIFEMLVSQGNLTVFGENVRAIETEGEHSAQGGAIAISLLGKRVSNFTSGQGIVYGLEQYYHAPGKLSTLVLNVGARALTKQALNVHCGHDDIMACLDTGWIQFMARDAQQAVDQTLILRRTTELSLTPGMNIQDGFLTTHLERTFLRPESELIRRYLGHPSDIIDTPTQGQRDLFGAKRRRIPVMFNLKAPAILGSVQNQEHYMTGVISRRISFCDDIFGLINQAQQEYFELTGRRYGLTHLYNWDSAETVFITLGSSAENIEAFSDYLKKTRNENVGVLHLNVIRPFPEKAIVDAIRGKKNVIVLERTEDPLSGSNPLVRDVRTAISKALENGLHYKKTEQASLTLTETPRVFEGVYGLGSRDFRPEGILGAYEFAIDKRPRSDGKWSHDGSNFFYVGAHHPYEVRGDETPSLLPEEAIAIRIHSIGGWGAITTGKNIAGVLGELSKHSKFASAENREIIHISANPKYGSEKKGAPTNYFLVVADRRIRVNCDLKHVDIVLCCDPKIFTHSNPLEGLKPGGCFVWESSGDESLAWQRIPKRFRKFIIENKIKIFTLDGFRIARQYTPQEELQTRMQGNAFLGAFFKVSSFLGHHGINEETFLKVVTRQYEKKFSKMGAPVVLSNLQVMKAGFTDVKNVAAGPIDALDESTMRGQVALPCSLIMPSSGQPTQNTPLFVRNKYRQEFLEGPRDEQSASPLASVGAIPAATGRDHSKFVSRIRVPVYNPYNCTQCLACLTVCPDTALPNTIQDIETILNTLFEGYADNDDDRKVLREHRQSIATQIRNRIKSEIENKSISNFRNIVTEVLGSLSQLSQFTKDHLALVLGDLPLGYGKAKPAFQTIEKEKPGSGGLFAIFVSDLCKGCGECVEACGDHQALTMTYENDLLRGHHLTGYEFYKLLPQTPKKFLGKFDPENISETKAAILQNHLTVQSNYHAFVGGDGACAGCGEKSVLRGIVTMTQALMEPVFAAKVQRLNALAKSIRENALSRINGLKKSNPQSWDFLKMALGHCLLHLGAETTALSLERMTKSFPESAENLVLRLSDQLFKIAQDHEKLQILEEGYRGMSVMGMAASTGCNTVYGSTHPANPHAYPWVNSLFQDGSTVGWLIAEGFMIDHIRQSIMPERLAHLILTENPEFREIDFDRFIHLNENYLDAQEILELPKVWVVGGDGALGDIGFQNLSKTILQNRPNLNILMLDTQVYSNTGGQNSDSSLMPGGFDMNQFSSYHQGKMTERKEVAQVLTTGHGSPFVASVSMANTASFYKAVLDGLLYRGSSFIQAYTTCQPEHGVGDAQSANQALLARDARVAPEFVFDPRLGEFDSESFSLKGNPNTDRDWAQRKTKSGISYAYTAVHWAATEGRFRRHFSNIKDDEAKIELMDLLSRITQDDVTYRRFLDPKADCYIPDKGVYVQLIDQNGELKPKGISRHLVLFAIERRKNWRKLQARAGLQNKDYENQKKPIKPSQLPTS